MWHVSSRGGVATLRTAVHIVTYLLTYLLTYRAPPLSVALASIVSNIREPHSAQLYFRQTVNDSKRAKIGDICLYRRRGRHSALTDAQKIV